MSLSHLLAEAKVRPTELARRVGVSHTTVLRWLDGRVPAERVAAVAQATGLSPAEVRPDLAVVFDPQATHENASLTTNAVGAP